MAAVPLDSYAPFDAGAGANVQENEWRSMMRLTTDAGRASGNGIVRLAGNEFRVFGDSSGSQVKVQTGECWIDGHWGLSSAEKIIPIANGDATNPRIDTIVLRMSSTDNNIAIDVLQGVPAVSPTAIAPTVNSTIYELQLAQVNVPALDTIIASNQVFDGRAFFDAPAVITRSTADTTVNNSTTFVDITGLTTPISYSSVYAIDGFIDYTAATAADLKIQAIYPSGTTGRMGFIAIDTAATTLVGSANFDTAPANAGVLVAGGVGTTDAERLGMHIYGWISTPTVQTVADPLTNSFNFKMQFAQFVANASNAVVYANSWIRLTRTS